MTDSPKLLSDEELDNMLDAARSNGLVDDGYTATTWFRLMAQAKLANTYATRIRDLELELTLLRGERDIARALLARIVKYAREDRAKTDRATRLARALAEADALIALSKEQA